MPSALAPAWGSQGSLKTAVLWAQAERTQHRGLRLGKQSLNSALEPLAGDAEDEGEEAGGSIMRLSCEGGRIPEQKQREE